MNGEYVGRREEGIYLPPQILEITDCLQWAFEALQDGHPERLMPDPFYVRGGDLPPLTDEEVDRLIADLDVEYDKEMNGSAAHHLKRSGATAHTDLHRLGTVARRALAERLDYVLQKHRSIDQTEAKAEGVAY